METGPSGEAGEGTGRRGNRGGGRVTGAKSRMVNNGEDRDSSLGERGDSTPFTPVGRGRKGGRGKGGRK